MPPGFTACLEGGAMKATAIALTLVGAYWVAKGFEVVAQDQTRGLLSMVAGILLLPLAWYFWNKKLGRGGSSE